MATGGNYFSSVKKAREALKQRAHEILDGYLATIKQAAASGDYESAIKGYQHIMDHMPAEDGERLIDISVDKVPLDVKGNGGPQVQIGIAIGGLNGQQQLPSPTPEVIVIEPSKDPASNS
jgi:hypothetical protein